jgi:hypothetical protein
MGPLKGKRRLVKDCALARGNKGKTEVRARFVHPLWREWKSLIIWDCHKLAWLTALVEDKDGLVTGTAESIWQHLCKGMFSFGVDS